MGHRRLHRRGILESAHAGLSFLQMCALVSGFALSLSCGGSDSTPQPPSTTSTAPSITSQPSNQSVTEGNRATFSVTASGTAPLSYQWRRNNAVIDGATSATYTTPVTSLADNGATFQVIVRNAIDSVSSSSVTLTVNVATGSFPGDVMAPWEGGPSYYSRWSHGPSTDSAFFPIAVWLQGPQNAAAYQNVGINLYVGLWEGPTEDQLSSLTTSALPVFCEQNAVGLTSAHNGVIQSWTQLDEPDNAQNNTEDPMPTADVISAYNTMVAADATRPVFLNLGQGVACDAWYGRGHRTNHPEDYVEYAKGGDILSFDTYPMNVFPRPTTDPDWAQAFNVLAQNIWYVSLGVDRLREWSNYQKPVWNWIECTNINGDSRYALTPELTKAEVWMSIIHGARGIGYFSHHWNPFSETGLLEVDAMRESIATNNALITALAPVLNTQSVSNGVTTLSSDTTIPVDTMVKRSGGYTYVFAVAMRPGSINATFTLRGFTGNPAVEVVGESRNLTSNAGVFLDSFTGHAVHIYKIPNP